MSNLLLTVPMSVNLISRLSHFIGVIASVTRRRRDIKIPLCLSAPVWKFNIVSNDHGRTHSFWLEIPFLGKFDQKSQNCQFKLKFGTQTNSNMQNSMAVFTFFCFRRKTLFLGKFGTKNQNCQFKLKFGT